MKFEKIFSKTGLDKKDISLIKFSITSIIAMLASFFSSCSNNGVKEPTTTTVVSTATYQVNQSTTDVQNIINTPDEFKKKNCGPTPGYPCGTKYYTISVHDFLMG